MSCRSLLMLNEGCPSRPFFTCAAFPGFLQVAAPAIAVELGSRRSSVNDERLDKTLQHRNHLCPRQPDRVFKQCSLIGILKKPWSGVINSRPRRAESQSTRMSKFLSIRLGTCWQLCLCARHIESHVRISLTLCRMSNRHPHLQRQRFLAVLLVGLKGTTQHGACAYPTTACCFNCLWSLQCLVQALRAGD